MLLSYYLGRTTLGGTLQPQGYRTMHYMGSLSREDTDSVTVANPWVEGEGFSLGFREGDGEPDDRIRLVFSSGEDAELRVEIAGYCLGVLRGALLDRFFYCASRKRALKIAA